ncbi:transcriptional adapter 2-alpha [Anaeramoeba flamelloides]|uniref:Transcriptional adapter 2-alpha n=1 Tax=Anaeramoeba flamelloides TaxID=1746091 RepID=A0AAV8AAH7_9EUKA|nr:transcriptional adapter 2-alpha [Anaeramoeba flamelloides]
MNSNQEGVRFICSNCEQDISNTIIVSCSVCSKIDLCPECFSSGAEFGTHLRSHGYSVYLCNAKPIYQKGWSVEEEMLLLEGISVKGFGNWLGISEYIGTKTKEEVETHYLDAYLYSDKSPLPETNQTISKKGRSAKVQKKKCKELYVRNAQRKNKHDSKHLVQRSHPKENNELYNKKKTFSSISGYMPKRHDFEVEYNNDSEKITETMGFDDRGIPWELKYKVLQGYNDHLKERIRRKNFVVSRELIYPRFLRNGGRSRKRKKSKGEKEYENKMKVFTRCFENNQDYEAVCQSFFDEEKLKHAIEKLKDWRENGITSIAEGNEFEIEKKLLLSNSKNNKRRTSNRKKLSEKSRKRLQKISPSSSSSSEIERTNLPGIQLLSEEELKISKQVKIIPQQYLAIKNQFLITQQVSTSTDLDQQKIDKITTFYRKNSWL